MLHSKIEIVSKKEDKIMVGRTLMDDGRLVTIIIATDSNGSEVDMVLDRKDSNQLLRSIAKASVITVNDLDDLYVAFERRYNPYPVQMSREEAFRHALQDDLIDEEAYHLAQKHYGNLWHYVGD